MPLTPSMTIRNPLSFVLSQDGFYFQNLHLIHLLEYLREELCIQISPEEEKAISAYACFLEIERIEEEDAQEMSIKTLIRFLSTEDWERREEKIICETLERSRKYENYEYAEIEIRQYCYRESEIKQSTIN